MDYLTPRELEVARLVAQDLSNQEIAGKLFIAFATVRTHVHRICVALDCRSRVDITRRAAELGLLA